MSFDRKALGRFACVVLLAGAVLLCTDETNPYTPDKVQVALLGSRFTDGATVQIFSTDTFRVELLLQAHVDSFRFHAPQNRYWPAGDTTIRKSSFTAESWPWVFRFPVSFYDTGWATVKATAWRSDGVVVTDSIRLHRISPLSQPDIVAEPGEVVTLSTDSVEDYVMYVWRFATGDSVVNDRPSATKLITGTSFTTGELYVRTAGIRSVPSDPFQVVLADRKPPQITCLNDSLSPDSFQVFTGSLRFDFRVRVQDAGSALASVLFNGTPSDSCHIVTDRQWECAKQLVLTPDGGPVRLIVRAADIRGNVAIDTFMIVFDSTLAATPRIVIYDLADSTKVPVRTFTVRGGVRNLYGTDTVFVGLALDGVAQGYTPALVAGASDWSWQVTLRKPAGEGTELYFVLERRAPGVRDTIDEVVKTVFYDSTVVDRIPPEITSVRSGGGEVLDGYYASASPLQLTIEAFDPSGVQWVRIDSVDARLRDGVYEGEAVLERGTSGNEIVISAADVFNNVAQTTRLVFLNQAPRITRLPSFVTLSVDSTYRDSVGAVDPDGDPLRITILIQSTANSYQVEAGPGGLFTWTPRPSDTGLVNLRAEVSDGYPKVAEGQWTIFVTSTAPASPPEFLTQTSEFPTALVAGRDTLRVTLRIRQSLDSGSYMFSARIVEKGVYVFGPTRDTALVWTPSMSDTGTWSLEVVVTNGAGLTDTITPLPQVTVRAPYIEPEVFFAIGSWTVTENIGTYLAEVQLSKPSPTPVSVGYRVLWGSPNSTADTSDIRLLGNRIRFESGTVSAQIPVVIVDDTVVEGIERFTLVLEDALPSDSITINTSRSQHVCYITDNDTAVLVDTVWFLPPLIRSGDEGNYDVLVGIRTSRPLSKQVQVDVIVAAATATEGIDFKKPSPSSIVMPQGFNRDTAVALAILDDTECEPNTEYVRLALKARTPSVVLRDSMVTFFIQPSDTPCVKPVGIIHGGNSPSSFELSIGRMVRDSMGYPVAYVAQQSVGSTDISAYSALVVSNSVTGGYVGTVLRNVSTPVLCASLPNWVSMELTSARGDTGQVMASTVRLVTLLPGLPSATVRITDGLSWIPFAKSVKVGATVVAIVDMSGVGGADGPGGGIAPITDTLKCIFQIPARNSPTGELVGRRCAFPMCRSSDGSGVPVYTSGWWRLFSSCIYWTLNGTWPIGIGGN